MKNKNIPQQWVITSLDSIAKWSSGGTPSRSNSHYFSGDILWVKTGELNNKYITDTTEKITEEAIQNSSAKIFSAGSVAIAMYGATIGKTSILGVDASTNQACAVAQLNPNYIDSEFMYYLLMNEKALFIAKGKGGAQPNISQAIIKKHLIALPAFAEQKQMVSRLNDLLDQADNFKLRIDTIPDIIKQFRESVLSDAISGVLTEDWRKENSITFWEINTFSDICKEITVGFVGKMSDKYKESGIPFFRSQNIKPFKVSNKNLLYISKEFHKQIHKSRLEAGDLAIVRTGAPGTTCVIPHDLGDANCSDLVIARPDASKLNSDYGCIFMNSELAKANVASNKVGVAQQHFNVGSMKKMSIILPPIGEQAEIVKHVEHYFSIANKIEQQLIVLQEKVNSLTPFILKKAFQGELTKDWRKNNPDFISGENSSKELLSKILSKQKKLKQQTTKVKKREKKMKITEETIKNTIADMPKSFTFDELREKIPAEYELLKNTTFSLLSMNPDFIEQFFDEESQMLRFKRLKQ